MHRGEDGWGREEFEEFKKRLVEDFTILLIRRPNIDYMIWIPQVLRI